jgi:hypothetical protein
VKFTRCVLHMFFFLRISRYLWSPTFRKEEPLENNNTFRCFGSGVRTPINDRQLVWRMYVMRHSSTFSVCMLGIGIFFKSERYHRGAVINEYVDRLLGSM